MAADLGHGRSVVCDDAPVAGDPVLGFEHVLLRGDGSTTVLLLHGTGGDEHDLVGLGQRVAPGATLLSPRGKVLENGASRFFRRLAVGRLDIPDLMARSDELALFIADAARLYELDPERIVALGLSNGANIAVGLLFGHPGLLRGAALLRPMLPYEPEAPPQLAGTDVLIAAGSNDPFSPPAHTERLAEILRGGGAQVSVSVAPGAGHALTGHDLQQTAAWIGALTAGL